jgi:hypothetical protein
MIISDLIIPLKGPRGPFVVWITDHMRTVHMICTDRANSKIEEEIYYG